MPLTAGQITFLNNFINGTGVEGENTLNSDINALVSSREDALALIRINANVANASCTAVLAEIKADLLATNALLNTLIATIP